MKVLSDWQYFSVNRSKTISSVICCNQQVNEELIKEPSITEIKEATFAIHPDKAQSPDGFSYSFFQANWEVVGPAVTKEIQLFISTGIFRPSQNVTR